MHNAALSGNAEIILGQLASQKGTSSDIKNFGNQMVTDHTSMATQLKNIAASLNYKLPADTALDQKHQQLKQQLMNTPSGFKWDSIYIDYGPSNSN